MGEVWVANVLVCRYVLRFNCLGDFTKYLCKYIFKSTIETFLWENLLILYDIHKQ